VLLLSLGVRGREYPGIFGLSDVLALPLGVADGGVYIFINQNKSVHIVYLFDLFGFQDLRVVLAGLDEIINTI
jgi:hypothetical protein